MGEGLDLNRYLGQTRRVWCQAFRAVRPCAVRCGSSGHSGKGAGDADCTPFSVVRKRWHGVLAVPHLQIVEQFLGPLSGPRTSCPHQMQDKRDIVGGIQERQQIVKLEDMTEYGRERDSKLET